ncbi:PucR family transcriptional regulator [Mesobacillus selenatarsenatis]|uniref:Fis-type helix-turn-helix domain protein n=1 Tax=Mesobacillus selenatarsenatis (strain DSM 18680 / JCM 14380 / FERM P-15431 / SF-1) TaxID=1321606 RepID=A0A0A8X7K5_MESS1|nr:helix-turn-helix domain-containing protein [Mesobacillus selenatarsenatis]GAM15017.1 Fis-type helix-turn-helix domain protein [Mesobacillus selenatarsenatis SF-1]
MINKILSYFPDSVTHEYIPLPPSPDYYWFKEADESPLWIGIPKNKISESQLELMKNLFEFVELENNTHLKGAAHSWNQFLFHDGALPAAAIDEVRFIQFKLQSNNIESEEIHEALKGFFPDHTTLWVKDSYGIIIEEKKEVPENADDLFSIASTLESDFYVKISFYIGKYKNVSMQLPDFFKREKQVFEELTTHTTRDAVYTFEKAFPLLLATHLPDYLKEILEATILEAFGEDKELMATIKVFLENNSNASLSAKKLYVHRNTLQYRLDKFMEKTGVSLKDFDAAVVVYLASIYEEMR